MQEFWDKINRYATLSEESRIAWQRILKAKTYKRNEFFVREGQLPTTVAFVASGLFSQYYTSEKGDVIIKRFFPENYLAASISALLKKEGSIFTIRALEPCSVVEYNFEEFKRLSQKHPDIAAVYIRYIEIHWIIEKEPLEISLRYDTAKTRYSQFLKDYPGLEPRLKQHEVASYLGVTPTQLSRIRAGQ